MPRTKTSSSKRSSRLFKKSELWIAPKTSLKRDGDDGTSWVDRPSAHSSRLLELADIALGFRKPQPFRKRRSEYLAAHAGKH